MTLPAIVTGLNALSNSTREAVTENELFEILKTGDGKGHLVRALFEDCSLETLEKIAGNIGLTPKQLLHAYSNAKKRHRASNEELDRYVDFN